MNPYSNLHVRGFRRLHDVNLKLKPLNVLIGANGCGKTSLLDVFTLLAASAAGRLGETINDFGGVDSNVTNLNIAKGGKAPCMSFELTQPVPNDAPMVYQLSVSQRGIGYEISEELLSQQTVPPVKYIEARRGHVRFGTHGNVNQLFDLDFNLGETALSQVSKLLCEPAEFRKQLASSTHYHVLDVSPRAPIRLPQQLRDAQLPGHNGESLVSCLFALRENYPERFESVQDTLRAGFPKFERLNFPPVSAGTLAMTWKETTSQHPFYLHQLSEGTLRFLWLVTLLQSPGLSAITLLDEPEVSLHPELLSLLADLMREASQRTQLIVATHADRLVRFLKPEEIITMNLNEAGDAELIWADELDLEPWLEEYMLDDVWRLGRMGGRA